MKTKIELNKLKDLNIPGAVIEFDPYDAENLGAFIEDALNEDDARSSIYDNLLED